VALHRRSRRGRRRGVGVRRRVHGAGVRSRCGRGTRVRRRTGVRPRSRRRVRVRVVRRVRARVVRRVRIRVRVVRRPWIVRRSRRVGSRRGRRGSGRRGRGSRRCGRRSRLGPRLGTWSGLRFGARLRARSRCGRRSWSRTGRGLRRGPGRGLGLRTWRRPRLGARRRAVATERHEVRRESAERSGDHRLLLVVPRGAWRASGTRSVAASSTDRCAPALPMGAPCRPVGRARPRRGGPRRHTRKASTSTPTTIRYAVKIVIP
jgi:hypothetical protein